MPKITDMQIQKNNKTRANVYVDGEYAMALEMLTVMKLGLKIGQEVSATRLAEAALDSEKSVAFEKAMGYLGRGMKTVKQMRDYLTKKTYSHEVVEYVIARLQEYRYLDDATYARTYVEHNSSTKGERRLKQELINKGISLSLAEDSARIDNEQALADAELLACKYMRGKSSDIKTLQKLQRYLLSRGYSYEIVNTILRNYKLDTPDTEE